MLPDQSSQGFWVKRFGQFFSGQSLEAFFRGQAGAEIPAAPLRIIEGGRTLLPSASLGARGGGDIPVMADDQTGRRAAEPFYIVKAPLAPDAGARLLHGQSGTIRFRAGTEALLPGWMRSLRQLLKRRYQL